MAGRRLRKLFDEGFPTRQYAQQYAAQLFRQPWGKGIRRLNVKKSRRAKGWYDVTAWSN